MTLANEIILVIGVMGAYLLGSLSSAVVVCRLLRLPDPRLAGSKNPGTTNVLRIGGKSAAALTLLADGAKGAVPVALIQLKTADPWIIGLVAISAVLGHLYPIFFNFKGGKGVATTIGALLALSPWLGSLFLLTWISVFIVTRYSSLAALLALVSLPVWSWQWTEEKVYLPLFVFLIGLIGWRHRQNIVRLINGSESKFSR